MVNMGVAVLLGTSSTQGPSPSSYLIITPIFTRQLIAIFPAPLLAGP